MKIVVIIIEYEIFENLIIMNYFLVFLIFLKIL